MMQAQSIRALPGIVMEPLGTIGFLLLKCWLMECKCVSFFPGTGEGLLPWDRRRPALEERQKQTELTDGGGGEMTQRH